MCNTVQRNYHAGTNYHGDIDLMDTHAIIISTMSMDRSLCAICAWRGDCNKKFMQGNGVFCPDYTKDLTIRAKAEEKKEEPVSRGKKGKKKSREIHLL